MKKLWLGLLFAPALAFAQVGFGPGPLPGDNDLPLVPYPPPTGAPSEICYPSGCIPVRYLAVGDMLIAFSKLGNGYESIGWSGPCVGGVVNCPSLGRQAFNDLWVNLVNATRAQSFNGVE